jgi:hypothetical protein
VWPRICMRFGQALLGKAWYSPASSRSLSCIANLGAALFPSLRSAHLRPPSARRKPWLNSRVGPAVSVRCSSTHLLHHERSCRLLRDPHHEHFRVHGCHEAGPAGWLPVGVVCH